MGGSKRHGRPLASRALVTALVIGAAAIAALGAAWVPLGLGPIADVGSRVALIPGLRLTLVTLAVGTALAVFAMVVGAFVVGAFAARAIMWRSLRLGPRALEIDAEQLGALAERRVARVTPAERDARALLSQLDDLRPAIEGIVASLREMDAWARWLLPRWEALAAKRRADGVAHLLEQLRRTRDAVDERVRGAEELAGATGRIPVGELDLAADDAALVTSARRLRDEATAVLRSLGGRVDRAEASELGGEPSGDPEGKFVARVRMGALYRRTAATLLVAHVVPLALVGAAWGVRAGVGLGGAIWPYWPYAATVGAVVVLDLSAAAWLARSAASAALPSARSLALAVGRLRAVEDAERAPPADGPHRVATLQASARTVRRGLAVAGGALEWPMRMGRPLFEAMAFDDAAGRHVVDIAAHEVAEATRVVVVLDQQITSMRTEIADLVERAAAAVRDGTRGKLCADELAESAAALLAVIVGGRRVEQGATKGAKRVAVAAGPDPRTEGESARASARKSARLGESLSWRERISHVMPRIRPARFEEGRRARHGVAGTPRPATFRALEPRRGRVTVVEEPAIPAPLPGVYRVATEAELTRFRAGGGAGPAAVETVTVIDAVEVWEISDGER
jgi:hypothetical protein